MCRSFGMYLPFVLVFSGLVPVAWAQESAQAPPVATTEPANTGDPAAADTLFRRLNSSRPRQGWFKTFAEHEREIWMSPGKLKLKDARWLVPLAASTALLMSVDTKVADALPNTPNQINTGQALSRIGAPYTLFGVAGGAYLIGRFTHNEHLRETGRIGTEALVHAFIITHVLKAVTGRQRPEDATGRGNFFQGRVSFPSGHGMMAWSLASVIAHEYRDQKLVVIGAYASALAVNAGRTMARKHFLSDTLVGSATGYLLGKYLYERNRQNADGSTAHWLPVIAPSYDRASKQAAISLIWQR